MITIRTKRSKEVKLLDIGEWWDYMHARGFGGLCYLEQAAFQSEKYKVCIDCLGTPNLVHITTRALIKSTDYYMCQECLDYYEAKNN